MKMVWLDLSCRGAENIISETDYKSFHIENVK